MSFIKIGESLQKKIQNEGLLDEIIALRQKHWFQRMIWYRLNWKKANLVRIKDWLTDAMNDPLMLTIVEKLNLKDYPDDVRMIEILKKVKKSFTYLTDKKKFGVLEYWQTPGEMWRSEEGDCEDFSVLVLTLARLSGIDWRRVMLCCGDVVGGGHAWIRYIPEQFPLNVVYLDGTYWTSLAQIGSRPFYYDIRQPYVKYIPTRRNGKIIRVKEEESKYIRRWWMVNDQFEWGAYKAQV